jgi:hypothetical protein
MSEREALARFHGWRAARDCKAAMRRGLAHPLHQASGAVSIGPATVVLATGTSCFCTRRLTVAQNFDTGR